MEKLTTVILSDRLMSLINKETPYAVAKFLGLNKQTVLNWYQRGTVMDDVTGVRIARELKIDPEQVVLWLQVERMEKKGNDSLSQIWRHIAEHMAA